MLLSGLVAQAASTDEDQPTSPTSRRNPGRTAGRRSSALGRVGGQQPILGADGGDGEQTANRSGRGEDSERHEVSSSSSSQPVGSERRRARRISASDPRDIPSAGLRRRSPKAASLHSIRDTLPVVIWPDGQAPSRSRHVARPRNACCDWSQTAPLPYWRRGCMTKALGQ